jgi:hypothetical protein
VRINISIHSKVKNKVMTKNTERIAQAAELIKQKIQQQPGGKGVEHLSEVVYYSLFDGDHWDDALYQLEYDMYNATKLIADEDVREIARKKKICIRDATRSFLNLAEFLRELRTTYKETMELYYLLHENSEPLANSMIEKYSSKTEDVLS